MKKNIISLLSRLFVFCFSMRYSGKVVFGKNCIVNWRFSFFGPGKLIIGDGCNLWAHEEWNRFQTSSKKAVISIGDNSRLNGVLLQSRESIAVGKKCLFGSTLVMDTDFHHADPKMRWNTEDIPTVPVKIGKNVWLAGQSVILKGVTIGDNSVVAIRAVVSKNIPKNTLVAGNPAREVKKL